VGWQTKEDVSAFHQQYGWNPTQEQWQQQGWTPRIDPQTPTGWAQYWPEKYTWETWPGGQGGGTGGGTSVTGTGQMPGYAGTTGPGWQYQEPSGYGQLQYPQQWGTASQALTPMAQTGMPTYQSPWYQQARGVAETDIRNAIAQAAETAGMKGLRWSSPLAEQAQRIAGERMGQVGLEWTGRELDALEQARQRQLQATGQLAGLGQQYFQAPMQYAQAAGQYGQGMMGARQQMLQPFYQEFMRRAPESSPWLQAAMQWSGYQWPGAQPQMYQPSGFSQFMSGISPFASLLAFL